MNVENWVQGDLLGISIPAHAEALRAGGVEFLTKAFRVTGVLSEDNSVAAITRFDAWNVGGTGHKVFLSVRYAVADPALPVDLFVKFSRNFDDDIRDVSRNQVIGEVRLALLSRKPGFPVAVPACVFADYQADTFTGMMITECIPFGVGAVEPHYPKCMDYNMPHQLEHYRALMKALGKLTGMQKAGLIDGVDENFPLDIGHLMTADSIPYTAQRLSNRVSRLRQFAAEFPHLLPPSIVETDFLERMPEEALRFLEQEGDIRRSMLAEESFLALAHWNANIDNAWFWRDDAGELHCGLLDWGGVAQLHMAKALWGCLSGVEIEIFDQHIDELLGVFIEAHRAAGGPVLDGVLLRRHFDLTVVLMGLAWLMDAPPLVRAGVPELADVKSRLDPRFEQDETARVQLQILNNFLHHWYKSDAVRLLAHVPASPMLSEQVG